MDIVVAVPSPREADDEERALCFGAPSASSLPLLVLVLVPVPVGCCSWEPRREAEGVGSEHRECGEVQNALSIESLGKHFSSSLIISARDRFRPVEVAAFLIAFAVVALLDIDVLRYELLWSSVIKIGGDTPDATSSPLLSRSVK